MSLNPASTSEPRERGKPGEGRERQDDDVRGQDESAQRQPRGGAEGRDRPPCEPVESGKRDENDPWLGGG